MDGRQRRKEGRKDERELKEKEGMKDERTTRKEGRKRRWKQAKEKR